MTELTVIEHEGQRVLTTEQLAEAYGCTAQQIKQNFNNGLLKSKNILPTMGSGSRWKRRRRADMETKEVQKMDRYEYCYQLIEDIGETADEIEKVFRLSRKEALESAIELVCRNSGRDEAQLMKLIKEA